MDEDRDRHPNAHGLPTSYELSDRLARVEEQQNYVADRLDEIAEKIDESLVHEEDVDRLKDRFEETDEKVQQHHFAYRVSRVLVALASVLLSSSVVASVMF